MKLKYGGDLQIGDFVAMSNGNYLTFGWYCGAGRGTLQYYYYRDPGSKFEAFQEWQNGQPRDIQSWSGKRYEKFGFSSKLFYKGYIYGSHVGQDGTRVMKVENPESIFTEQEDLESYRKSKEALIYIKFPAK
jgi:hypothetical protein